MQLELFPENILGNVSVRPTDEELNLIKKNVEYEPETGKLYRCFNSHFKEITDPNSHGYYRVTVGHKTLQAHNVAWFLFYNEWPVHQLDHKDRNKINNKIDNLRYVSATEQAENKSVANTDKYIYYQDNGYNVIIPENKELGRKRTYLGRRKTITQAKELRDEYLGIRNE